METQEITEKLNKIIKNETSIFQRPIIPGECPTFDEETANYVELYLKSWVLPKLDEVLRVFPLLPKAYLNE